MALLQRIHHVAYRCRDAKQTVEWYRANRSWWEPLKAAHG